MPVPFVSNGKAVVIVAQPASSDKIMLLAFLRFQVVLTSCVDCSPCVRARRGVQQRSQPSIVRRRKDELCPQSFRNKLDRNLTRDSFFCAVEFIRALTFNLTGPLSSVLSSDRCDDASKKLSFDLKQLSGTDHQRSLNAQGSLDKRNIISEARDVSTSRQKRETIPKFHDSCGETHANLFPAAAVWENEARAGSPFTDSQKWNSSAWE